MDLVKINGVVYDVLVSAIQEKASVVEGKNSGTALYRQRDIRDIVGIKYAHSITFSPSDEAPEKFDELFSELFDKIHESVFLEVVHGQDVLAYEATYTTGSRNVAYISKKTNAETEEETDLVGWDELTVDFVSRETIVNASGV